jgi:hypothetical protein
MLDSVRLVRHGEPIHTLCSRRLGDLPLRARFRASDAPFGDSSDRPREGEIAGRCGLVSTNAVHGNHMSEKSLTRTLARNGVRGDRFREVGWL